MSGTRLIRRLPPGQYQIRANGATYPIEIKAGEEAKFTEPLKWRLPYMGGGG